ncbi:hypothetical protein [Streptomyces sp. NPDC059224]|uniref:hypothetical protein n=1 Tax=Streptomyces sp. NPDC059224 TaxID=3346775 RepID=UPI0036748629
MRVFAESTDLRVRHRVPRGLPTSRAVYPPHLREPFDTTLASAQVDPDQHIRHWAAVAGQ